jgi:tol-pal system beta propeller repeat protein TolB
MYWVRGARYDIAVMAANGSSFRRLTRDEGSERSPLWSPDGTQILYSGGGSHAPGIYVMDRAGRDHTRVTDDGRWYALGGWSRDGARLVVAAEAEEFEGRFPDTEIVTMDLTGRNRVNLTRHPAADRSPSWSPDGTRIAFTSDRDGDGSVTSDHQIYTMDADGENQTRLTYDVLVERGRVSWSPDGGRIAFTSRVAIQDGWQPRISIMYADGSGRIDLTTGTASDRAPAWSPDGHSLAFVSDRDAGLVFDKLLPGWVPEFWEIYVLDVSNVTPVRSRGGKLATWGRLKASAGAIPVHGQGEHE